MITVLKQIPNSKQSHTSILLLYKPSLVARPLYAKEKMKLSGHARLNRHISFNVQELRRHYFVLKIEIRRGTYK